MNPEEHRRISVDPSRDPLTDPLDDPLADPLRGADSHVVVGTPLPDDPEELLDDVDAAQSALGLPSDHPADGERSADLVRRATDAAGRAGTAGLARLRQTADRLRATRPGHGEAGPQAFRQHDESLPQARAPYLLVAGLALAGLTTVVVVLRRRRG